MMGRNSTADRRSVSAVVIGAGLSGLASAYLLARKGHSVCILEADKRVGGRVRSLTTKTGEYIADLGPSWVWPEYQPVMKRWINELGISLLDHYSTGATVIDMGPKEEPRIMNIPFQSGVYRLVGGPSAITSSLFGKLPEQTLVTGARVEKVSVLPNALVVHSPKLTVEAERLIVATPPRIAGQAVDWHPKLPKKLQQALNGTPTWMAMQAKVVICFDSPFWRDQGISGRMISQHGPITELHDHFSPNIGPAALWGFLGWSKEMREQRSDSLESEIRLQLKRSFGQSQTESAEIHVLDWADNLYISSHLDALDSATHPKHPPEALICGYFDNRIAFSSAETGRTSPGLLEGALEAAERAVKQITLDTDVVMPAPATDADHHS